MPSPLPGMDPYLEDAALWPAFHHQLVMCLYQILLPGLVDRCRVRLAKRSYNVERTPAALSDESRLEDFVEIRQRSDGRLVTLLEVVGPANKTTASGRAAYLDTRREARASGASLVEIDLVLQGQTTLEYSRDGLPDWEYAVAVVRSSHAERYEIYTATLQKRLPRFRLPLAADDRNTVLDLHTAFTRCYNQGGFAARIDYACDPPVPLDDADRRWLDDVLMQQYLRRRLPSHEEIAKVAYSLWEQERRTHGRDRQHWSMAIERLRRVIEIGKKAP